MIHNWKLSLLQNIWCISATDCVSPTWNKKMKKMRTNNTNPKNTRSRLGWTFVSLYYTQHIGCLASKITEWTRSQDIDNIQPRYCCTLPVIKHFVPCGIWSLRLFGRETVLTFSLDHDLIGLSSFNNAASFVSVVKLYLPWLITCVTLIVSWTEVGEPTR